MIMTKISILLVLMGLMAFFTMHAPDYYNCCKSIVQVGTKGWINGNKIDYSRPSAKGRKIFGTDGGFFWNFGEPELTT